MFAEFLNIIFKSIKLDKTLYSDNKNFGEASIYFAGIIMILDGIAGAVAANTIIKNDKSIIPKDLKLDFKLNTCFVEIIKPAKIQN